MQFDPKIMKMLRLGLSRDNSHIIIRSAAGQEDTSEYSFGIEEEYFLADATSLNVAIQTPNELFEAASWSTGGQAMREMLQAQLEVATNIHLDIRDAREELKFLRREVAAVAAQYGLAIMACGTHPTAIWRQSVPSPKPRYEEMIEDLRTIGHRNMLCGMHVHVQLPDPENRFAVMQAMIPHIPLLIALSTSSPFWNSKETGLKGYRLAAYDELPRTGLPEVFESKREYDAYVAALKDSGVIPDESYIWWAMRPSSRHPTLELRAPDVCTSIDDALAVASLYRSLVRHLHERPALSHLVTSVDRAIAVENKWRAQRYGTDCIFASKDGPIPIKDALSSLIQRVSEDASALGCSSEVEHCRLIVERGSSADCQLSTYRESGEDISAVLKWIASATGSEQALRSRRFGIEP
ncbi:carboxylate-amine ligase [Bradyrhizobium retamae]|uniref:Putative glutamate--cysteine ligase 2 n=1 Tax=Bradyrhizobium retamae TaxID=1300035 RepID=A0A0R3NC78_9BRAD|nr:carboxylate-amine ligase [Bradyrhizobium retamae]KRR27645.1 carboxylate--amine ligase [Bradyrhizobium retamae]